MNSTIPFPLFLHQRATRLCQHVVLCALFVCGIPFAHAQTWSNRDIGSVGVAGSFSVSNGVYTVKGSGADIWGTVDAFRYGYQSLSGDGEIIARVSSVQNTNVWAKAGVMIRETIASNSRHAMIVLTPGNGVSFQRRTSTGGASTSTTVGGPIAPYWVRIVRTGSSFSGYRSSNGTSWTLVGTATVTMTANVQIGLAVTSHNNSVSCTTKFDNVKILRHPTVAATAPANGATNVFRNTAINADVTLPNAGAGVDDRTLNANSVQLYRTSNGSFVPGGVNTTGGGDAIVYQPSVLLDPSTGYTFKVTAAVKDLAGQTFVPFTMTFTTGTTTSVAIDPRVHFSKRAVYGGNNVGAPISSLLIGPDGKLYGASIDGNLRRWAIAADGSLTNLETYSGLSGRAIIGFVFDPLNSNAIWIANNDTIYVQPANDWTGRISRLTLTAPGFTGLLEDYVVGLPRSAKDHVTNSLAFGPDGNLYVTQGSCSAMGAPDDTWFNRSEHLLSAAVLKIDPRRLTGYPFNVQTESPGTYNPYAAGVPVTIFGMGNRNSYDLVWHSNGFLYCPTNGSAAGGNCPASPAGVTPVVPAITNGPTQDDFLFKVVQGGYYGHPNTTRGQYVMNGGNPTSGTDPAEVVTSGSNPGYPVGVQPDSNYRGFAWNFGRNRSPDGAIEYKSATFGGALTNKLLVVEYSGGDDILALALDANGNVSGVTQVIAGLNDPLDIVENQSNGSVYVAEFYNGGAFGQISLLTPTP
jgi:regulation of enolase protein 1 (concanavalin A-like superfamily)